jgi:hypothetical protein
MDAIRKKMKSLKDETDQLYAIIEVNYQNVTKFLPFPQKFEDATKEAKNVSDQVGTFM